MSTDDVKTLVTTILVLATSAICVWYVFRDWEP